MAEASVEVPKVEITRYESLPKALKVICLVLWTIGIGLFILYVFGWSIRGWVLEDVLYYYLLYATLATCVFLLLPARRKDRNRVPLYDLVLAAFIFGTCIYFASNTWEITYMGWSPAPTMPPLVLAGILCFVAVEGGRRMAGLPLAIICLLLGIYPLFAEHMPGVLYGYSFTFPEVISAFAFGRQGMLGLPAQVIGNILIGFLIFAGMLIASGAGAAFLNLALALMGRFRGGSAKVAVLASGFFGSLTGTPVENIVATGSVTIPAMKRLGYPPHYAGAIEAVASTGGIIMPPVMGAIAFIMAVLTNIPYAEIIIAAIIPAILYYWGLLVQVDAYAARVGLKGLPKEKLPSLIKTLKQCWIFIAVIIFLVFGLIYMRWGVKAPVYASGLLFFLSFTSRETMMTPRKFIASLTTIGNLITFIMALFFPICLLLVGLQISGSLTALTAEIISFGQGNVILLLLIAAVICYLFGMVGMALIPYIVLAVTALPAIISATGLNIMALHLFLIYYFLTTGITPPVCVSAFTAAAVAGSSPMKTGFTAMRLAVVLYFIPFFFVFNPSLILEGPILETVYLFVLCLVGIWILASGLEGYLLKVGRLKLWSRVLLFASGFLIAFPGYGQILTWWMTSIIGAALAVLVIAVILIRRKTAAGKLITNSGNYSEVPRVEGNF